MPIELQIIITYNAQMHIHNAMRCNENTSLMAMIIILHLVFSGLFITYRVCNVYWVYYVLGKMQFRMQQQ